MLPHSSKQHQRAPSSLSSPRSDMGVKQQFSMDFHNGGSHWHNRRLQRIAIFAVLSMLLICAGVYRQKIYANINTPSFSVDSIDGLHKYNSSKTEQAKLPFLKDSTDKSSKKEEPLVSILDPYVHDVAKTHIDPELMALDHTRVALLIETRPLPHLPALLLHFISVLPLQWTVRFMASPVALEFIERSRALQMYIQTGKLLLIDLPSALPVTTSQGISEVFTSLEFYRDLLAPAEWLLMFQSDSIVCAASDLSLDDWVDMGYTYIGAPWFMGTTGGNGGLSLRHVPEIIHLLSDPTVPPREKGDERFEDRWLSDTLTERPGARMPNGTFTNHFSVESVWSERPLGYHLRGSGSAMDQAIWGDDEKRTKIFKYCPEIKIILENADLKGYGKKGAKSVERRGTRLRG